MRLFCSKCCNYQGIVAIESNIYYITCYFRRTLMLGDNILRLHLVVPQIKAHFFHWRLSNSHDAWCSECEPTGAEKDRRQEFDQEIADGDRAAAIPALATEINPCQQGDVQIPGDGVVAGRAMGPG